MDATKLIEERSKPLEKNLLLYIWRTTKREQFWILFIILISMPTYFMVFELPKRIINGPIQGGGFENGNQTVTYLNIVISTPQWLGGYSLDVFPGFEITRTGYLIALSFSFLGLVCINGLLKFYINTRKGRLGERMLRRIRYQLVDRVLRFPVGQFSKIKGSEIASMVKDEVEPFGEFIGDAINQPFLLGSQALIAFAFIFIQSVSLALLTVVTVALQVGIIPVLRRRVLELGRKRQITARQLSGRIGEEVEGIAAIHVNDTSNYERAEVTDRLGQIFDIRYELFQRKFFAKFVGNFLSQFTPFLFYLVGGYFAIKGSLDIGQLVAAIGAYKELPSPINSLIMWDQKRTDINIKYAQIIENFNVEGMANAEMQAPVRDVAPLLNSTVEISGLGVVDETGATVLENINLNFEIREIIAAVGLPGSGFETLPAVLARLRKPTSGRVVVDGKSLLDLPESVVGRRFGYVDSGSYLPQDTLGNTLVYPLKRFPIHKPVLDEASAAKRERDLREVIMAGNCDLDLLSDWVDYQAAGATGPGEIERKLLEVLRIVELDELVYELALRQKLDPSVHSDLCDRIVSVRNMFHDRLKKLELDQFVDLFDNERYARQATVAENILFGTVSGNSQGTENLVKDAHMRRVLAETGLDSILFDMGIELARTAIELFADLSPDNPFFEQLNFLSAHEIEEYPSILSGVAPGEFSKVSELARQKLLMLSFRYSEPRNRLGLLDEEKEALILKTRRYFQAKLPESLRNKINFYEKHSYNSAASLQDNILLGRIVYGYSEVTERVYKEIQSMLEELGMKNEIWRTGLLFNVGSGGKRLTEAQRQKVVLGRTLLKRPDLLIVNQGLNTLDLPTQQRIAEKIVNLARSNDGWSPFGILWALTAPAMANRFDRVIVFDAGKLTEDGVPADLTSTKGAYSALVS